VYPGLPAATASDLCPDTPPDTRPHMGTRGPHSGACGAGQREAGAAARGGGARRGGDPCIAPDADQQQRRRKQQQRVDALRPHGGVGVRRVSCPLHWMQVLLSQTEPQGRYLCSARARGWDVSDLKPQPTRPHLLRLLHLQTNSPQTRAHRGSRGAACDEQRGGDPAVWPTPSCAALQVLPEPT